jgi:hypothetical protein
MSSKMVAVRASKWEQSQEKTFWCPAYAMVDIKNSKHIKIFLYQPEQLHGYFRNLHSHFERIMISDGSLHVGSSSLLRS